MNKNKPVSLRIACGKTQMHVNTQWDSYVASMVVAVV